MIRHDANQIKLQEVMYSLGRARDDPSVGRQCVQRAPFISQKAKGLLDGWDCNQLAAMHQRHHHSDHPTAPGNRPAIVVDARAAAQKR